MANAQVMKVRYRKRSIKYVLESDHWDTTAIRGYDIDTPFIRLTPEGRILKRAGYGWDGCSGPTKDDKTNQRGGLNHDAKYQLMRMGLLPQSCRAIADIELKQECKEDGMGKIRYWYYYEGVNDFAAYAARYGTEPKIEEAP